MVKSELLNFYPYEIKEGALQRGEYTMQGTQETIRAWERELMVQLETATSDSARSYLRFYLEEFCPFALEHNIDIMPFRENSSNANEVVPILRDILKAHKSLDRQIRHGLLKPGSKEYLARQSALSRDLQNISGMIDNLKTTELRKELRDRGWRDSRATVWMAYDTGEALIFPYQSEEERDELLLKIGLERVKIEPPPEDRPDID